MLLLTSLLSILGNVMWCYVGWCWSKDRFRRQLVNRDMRINCQRCELRMLNRAHRNLLSKM